VRAGLLKRLGKDDLALASYADGAKIETEAKLGSTYNRMNEVRTALLDLEASGQDDDPKKSGPEDISETVAALLAQAAHTSGQADRKGNSPEETGRAPAQLAAAKTVFIAFPHTGLNASVENADELYYKAFSEPGRWGRFEIASTPSQADLIADLERAFATVSSGITQQVVSR